jgi:hypothetical protein
MARAHAAGAELGWSSLVGFSCGRVDQEASPADWVA